MLKAGRSLGVASSPRLGRSETYPKGEDGEELEGAARGEGKGTGEGREDTAEVEENGSVCCWIPVDQTAHGV